MARITGKGLGKVFALLVGPALGVALIAGQYAQTEQLRLNGAFQDAVFENLKSGNDVSGEIAFESDGVTWRGIVRPGHAESQGISWVEPFEPGKDDGCLTADINATSSDKKRSVSFYNKYPEAVNRGQFACISG